MNPNNFTVTSQGTAPPYQNFIPQPNFNNQINNNPISQDVDYAENILELNTGKFANFYMSYSDSLEWRDKIFSGILLFGIKIIILGIYYGLYILVMWSF